MQFRTDIQGLRALAFLLVFLFHLNPNWLPGGYIGVDLFFVISGYLLSTIILNQRQAGTFSLWAFYQKRIKRIAPAYFFMLIAVALAGYFFYLPSDAGLLRGTLLRSALFISNHLFAKEASYFGAQSHENPLLHTWSLAIEVQFYLLIPLFLLYVKRKALPYVTILLIVGLLAYSSWQIYANHAHSAMYFSLVARIPEFLLGTLFSLISPSSIKSGRARTVAAFTGMAGILAAALLLTADSDFPGFLSAIPCISIGLILVSGQNAVTRALSLKPLVQLGKWSYSLYLWHWPIIAFMRYNMVDFGKVPYLLITIATFAVASLSYRWVEQRFKSLGTPVFIARFSPVMVLAGIAAYFLPLHVRAHRPDIAYLRPVFGLESHAKPFVQTLGSESPTLEKRILLIGNSHALMMKPFLDYIGKRAGFAFQTISTDAYPAITGIEEAVVPANYNDIYQTALSLIPLTEQAIQNSDIILFVMHNYAELPPLKDALTRLIGSLRPHQKLVLVNSFPILRKHPLRVNRSILKTGHHDFKTYNLSRSTRLVEEFDAAYPNVYSYDVAKSKIFDTIPFFNDTLTYYNAGHINTRASLAMGNDLYADFSDFLYLLIE